MNIVFLIGHLGRDPEIRFVAHSGDKLASVSLATSKRWKDKDGRDQERTTWHELVAWQKKADVLEKYCHKGDKLCVTGEIETQEWTPEGATEKRRRNVIRVDRIELLEKPQRSDDRQLSMEIADPMDPGPREPEPPF